MSGSWDIIPALIDLGHLVFPDEEEGEAIKCVRYSVLKLMLMVVMRSVSIISTFQTQKRFSVQHCTEEDWKVWSVNIFEKLTSSLNDQ